MQYLFVKFQLIFRKNVGRIWPFVALALWNGYVNDKIPPTDITFSCLLPARFTSIGTTSVNRITSRRTETMSTGFRTIISEGTGCTFYKKTCFQCIKSSCYESLLKIIVPPKVWHGILFSSKMNYRNVDKIWNGYVNDKIPPTDITFSCLLPARFTSIGTTSINMITIRVSETMSTGFRTIISVSTGWTFYKKIGFLCIPTILH